MKTTFTLNYTEYTVTDNGYYYKTVNGKKSRISLKAFEAARNAKIAEDTERELAEAFPEQIAEDALDAMQAELDASPSRVEPAVLTERGLIDCRDCDNKTCIHRDCMRRNPEEVGGLGLCPRWIAQGKTTLDVSKDLWDEMLDAAEAEDAQETKKKRTRKSKDIAYTYSENGQPVVTLTAKQVDFVKHISDTCFWEHGLDSCIWVDCLCDEIGGQFAGKPMTVGAMISTLCEKGLGQRAKSHINGISRKLIILSIGKSVYTDTDT